MNDAADRTLEGLNEPQARAVLHGTTPLLIIAGAGTGKTKTLVHRVAHAISQGVDPQRLLLLTFTRRAAAEMLRRVDGLLQDLGLGAGGKSIAARTWGGTFHATAARLLRMHGDAIGLDRGFSIHDRGDSEDLLDAVRLELGMARTDERFPKKRTCMAIYSHAVNSREPLDKLLASSYPWCAHWTGELKRLFEAYAERKDACGILDYDDLLLFWRALVEEPRTAERVRGRFDRIFVDEYQDTNRLQAEILKGLTPDGSGLTVVGDDAQSIYSFRAATVRNILDFPKHFAGASVVTLEQNYRSSEPILAATNRVIAASKERYKKELWSARTAGRKPLLVTCQDEDEQTEFLVRSILERREEGLALKDQAVLFRASQHSILLEAELTRRKIPYVKYGGLKFIETAHVKDLLAFLRLAENPRDTVSGARVLTLLPGIGPRRAAQLMARLASGEGSFEAWRKADIPAEAKGRWPKLVTLLGRLSASPARAVSEQVHLARTFYVPIVKEKYDSAPARLRDLEQIEQLAGRYQDRRTLLAEVALDPPNSTQDLAGPPLRDDDYLILSTIHSAKGLEWGAVYVIHASDGNIPSDLATGSREQIEEELRLFYVALTRARDWLYVCYPQRYYFAARPRGDDHSYAQLSRFVPSRPARWFELRTARSLVEAEVEAGVEASDPGDREAARQRMRQRIRAGWH